jgi:hypothetical protein
MSYVSGSEDAPDEAAELESVRRVEAGGIPLGAERRVRELAAGNAPFTSTLSVSESGLLSELGPSSARCRLAAQPGLVGRGRRDRRGTLDHHSYEGKFRVSGYARNGDCEGGEGMVITVHGVATATTAVRAPQQATTNAIVRLGAI